MLLLLVAMLACDDGPGPNTPMNADHLRWIVVQAHVEFRRHGERTLPKAPTEKCSGERLAMGSFPAAKVRHWLTDLVTGPALRCYYVSYLGCTIDGQLVRAGATETTPAFGPYQESKVVIVQQTKTRIVADVSEIESQFIDDEGGLVDDYDPALAKEPPVEKTSRYTLVRDAAGRWRIHDRKPNFAWTCAARTGVTSVRRTLTSD